VTFQITLSEHRSDGTVVPLLFGETDADMPTLLCAYNLELLLHGGYVDCTRFCWEEAAGDDLVRVLAGLTSGSTEKLCRGSELRFRIEQEGDFLLETRPYADPRALLGDVLADSLTSGMSGHHLVGVLLWNAQVVEACSYAASCGWGRHTPEVLFA
jgi:hypothetical protein